MAVENRIQFYGISIESNEASPRFYGISIESNEASPRFYGISIDTNNFFNGKLIVVDENGANISGATVTITSTQTNPKNYAGDLILTTDSNGICEPTGSSTTGTTLKIEKTGYTTYEGPMMESLYGARQYSIGSDPSKRMYVTNRGNIVLNPNNTTLIEIN
jgi:hypothetical protein